MGPQRRDARGRAHRDGRAGLGARDEELEQIRVQIGDDEWFEREGRPALSRELFEQVALSVPAYEEFLTMPAYAHLEG